MRTKEELQSFILENWEELGEMTTSSGMAIGYPNVPAGEDTDERVPMDVHDKDIEDTEDTDEKERGSQTKNIKPGSGGK